MCSAGVKTLSENHHKQNDEWLERMRQEIDAERRATAEENMTWQRANEELQIKATRIILTEEKEWMPL